MYLHIISPILITFKILLAVDAHPYNQNQTSYHGTSVHNSMTLRFNTVGLTTPPYICPAVPVSTTTKVLHPIQNNHHSTAAKSSTTTDVSEISMIAGSSIV